MCASVSGLLEAVMLARYSLLLAAVALAVAFPAAVARAQDIDTCLAIADRVAGGEEVSAADKEAGHKACQAALAATASIVQKSQIQDADFDIMGRPATKPN
jgi:hypothetical protein